MNNTPKTTSKPKRHLCILACSRSGTKYMSLCLREFHLAVGHERVWDYGGCGWTLLLPEWFDEYEWKSVIHQVREPISAIASMHGHVGRMWKRVATVIGPLPKGRTGNNYMLRCARYWMRWNLECEKRAAWRYRIEDIHRGSSIMPEFYERVGLTAKKGRLWPAISRTTNTRKHPTLTWADFDRFPKETRPQLIEMSRRYGYPVTRK